MTQTVFLRLTLLVSIACGAIALASSAAYAQAPQQPRNGLKEPIYRTAANASDVPVGQAPHPLDPALQLARDGLDHIRQNVVDYRCLMVKRERINGELQDYEYMMAKIRNRKVDASGRIVTPLSVYLYFLKPASVRGREVVYVEGQNNNKLCAHEGGTKGRFLPTVWLKPDSLLAMRGQRYPITEAGIENLVAQLIKRGERDKKWRDVEVQFFEEIKINDRDCRMLQVKHATPKPELDFHVAQIFIDKELNVPIRYAAFDFPATPGGQPEVIEEYTYLDLKLNVGLTDADFDPNNPEYNFFRQSK